MWRKEKNKKNKNNNDAVYVSHISNGGKLQKQNKKILAAPSASPQPPGRCNYDINFKILPCSSSNSQDY